MTLAFILLFSFCCTAPVPPWSTAGVAGQSAPEAAPDAKPAAAGDQNQGKPAQEQTPAAPSKPASSASSPAQTPSAQKPARAKRPHHRKRVIPANCNSAPAAATGSAAASAGATSATPVDAAGGSTQAPSTPTAPTNCPPSKIIVRHGGTSEPSIQLAGGAVGDQAASQRNTANQMLGSTEENLKKLAGRQLSANQQDMVSQVRQFMDQSKTAVAAGDLERARTLAWKAQLLSEELVKPEK